jgi:type VI secretion system protein ImpJ
MTQQAVHWHEGMFLRPQHFQAAERHVRHWTGLNSRLDSHYNWGLRRLDLDLDALANHRIEVGAMEARLRDGTLISIPGDARLSDCDLRAAFAKESTLTVSLGLPLLQAARANISAVQTNKARYVVDELAFEDENTGLNPQRIQVRLLNVQLLTSVQDNGGYETLPLGRVRRGDVAEAAPELDETYIPPLLACDAWKPLLNRILHPIYDRLGKKIDLLSQQITARGITFDSQGQGDRQLLEQLRVLNESYAPLSVAVFAQGVHPYDVYLELCRLVGRLSVFGPARRPPQVPRYDHDDLGTCFWRAKQYIDELLDVVIEPDYRERPFVGAGLRMQVALEPAWLEAGRELFVGVQSPLSAEQAEKLLNRGLDAKLGSSDRVDEIFRLGQAGLKFAFAERLPRALPQRPGLVYFQIDRGEQAVQWDAVKHSLTLAIRLNENLISGNIQGERILKINANGQQLSLQFMLFVVQPS